MKSTYKIKGIDCANCAAQLENAISKVEGVESVSISFMAERMVIEYDDKNKEEIMKKIKKVIKREEPDATIEEI
jgi:copper chaperone CopZ